MTCEHKLAPKQLKTAAVLQQSGSSPHTKPLRSHQEGYLVRRGRSSGIHIGVRHPLPVEEGQGGLRGTHGIVSARPRGPRRFGSLKGKRTKETPSSSTNREKPVLARSRHSKVG